MAAVPKAGGENVAVIAQITNSAVLERWPGIERKVVLTDERIGHIVSGHAQDYERYHAHIPEAIESPDLVLEDVHHAATAMFVKRVTDARINVIVRLACEGNDSGRMSSVMTMYQIGTKRLRRLLRNHPALYNSGETCYNEFAEDRPK